MCRFNKAPPPLRAVRFQKERRQTIVKSRLFVSTEIPTAEYVAEEAVELFGLKTVIYVTALKTVYVVDDVEPPAVDDAFVYKTLTEAEKEMAKREVDPYADPKKAVDIIEAKAKRGLGDAAPCRALWR